MFLRVMPVLLGLTLAGQAVAGTWTPIATLAPDSIDTTILLSDGTVMAASGTTGTGAIGNAWYRLTPDIHGSYVNGTWTTLAPMIDTRLYYASQVLPDGRFFVAGGEYGSGTQNAEIYDPLANTWTETAAAGQEFIDCESELLPNGNVLISPVFSNPAGTCVIYNVASNTWSSGGTLVRGITLDEASWIKLPDDSILTLDPPGTGFNSERYIPSLNKWVDDAILPVSPWETVKFEMGAGFLLPDGRGFYLGSSSHTVYYTPSGSSSPGSFSAGPDIPNNQGTPDAPAAMMLTGKILCAVGPNGTVGGATNFPGPTVYYEFDPVTQAFVDAGTPTGNPDLDPPFIKRMLDLPDGSILLSGSSQQLYVYNTVGAPVPSGKPTITSISSGSKGSFHLVGTLLNGISEGAGYGDDAQESTSRPIVRLTDVSGNIFYARTHDWSSTSVMTGNKPLSTEFTVPTSVPPGSYSLVVIANGISSDPVAFTAVPTPDLDVVTNFITGGNGNGMIDFNECNNLSFVISNTGGTNATTVTGKLTSTTPGVVIAQPIANFPNVPVGTTVTNTSLFQVSTTPAFICGTPVVFNLTLSSDQVTVTRTVTIITGTVGQPIGFTNSLPVPIAPGAAGSSSAIVVTNITTALKNVTVQLYVQDQFDFGLTLTLTGPDGTKVLLTQGNGGSGQNYGIDCTNSPTIFDDAAGQSINAGIAPFAGTFQPDNKLATFIGKVGTNVNGTWLLNASDQFSFFGSGQISCWSMLLSPAGCFDGGGQCPGVDLSLGMTGLPNPIFVQSNLTYTISVTNNGPDTATGVAVSQTLPPNVIFQSALSSQGFVTQSGNILNANLGTLVVGATATVNVIVIPTSTNTLVSTASVGSQQTELNPPDNSATVTNRVNSVSSDISVVLTANPSPVLLNGLLTYTAKVVNNGPDIATNVLVTNTLPLNVNLVSFTSSQGAVGGSGNLVFASLGQLPAGSNAIVTMQVQPLVLGTITATSAASSSLPDPSTANNTSSVTVAVTPAADLALTLSGPSSVVVGSNITYQVTVLNQGPSVATGITIKDSLPANVGFVSATNSSPNAGAPTFSGGIVTCVVTNLAMNASTTLTVVGSTTSFPTNVPVTVLDTATLIGTQADPNTNNNSATLSTLVTVPTINVVNAGFVLTNESFLPKDGMIESNETVTVVLRLQNLGNIDTANITATLLASNGVVPVGNPTQGYGTLALGSAAVGRPFTFVANATNGGTITANLLIQNGASNLPTPVKFVFNVANVNRFANTNNIIIPDHGPATPYPSTNIVAGVAGVVGHVTVTMTNVNHTFPDDVDMLLVGPGGQSVVLMAHAGAGGILTNATLTFDDAATNTDGTPAFLPPSSQIISGTYVPSAYGSFSFPTNAPAPPYSSNLTIFNGVSANGVWRLFVFDSSPGDQGIIVGGWSLNITSGSVVNPVVDLAVTGKSTPASVVDGSTLTYTYTITNNGPNMANVVSFTNTLPAGVTVISATNSAHVATPIVGNGSVSCILTNLSGGSNVTVTVVVIPNVAGLLSSVATVSGSDTDPNQSNNSATVTTPATVPVADVGLTMTGATNGVVGNTLVYNLTVTNSGPGTAVAVVVSNALNGQLLDLSSFSSVPGAVFFTTNGAAICSLGNLAANTSATITLVVDASVAGIFTNTAVAITTSSDTNAANNTATVTTLILPQTPNIVAAGAHLITQLPNGSITPGATVTVSLQLANTGTADTANLVGTLLATNGVTPVGTPAQNYGVLAHGGPAKAGSYTFTASGANNAVITATLQLTDGTNSLGTVSFNFNLPGTNTFANINAIVIPDHGVAGPYPSTITLSGINGVVSKASVTISNFSHQFPNDVEIMVVSPSGQSTVLMSGVGGSMAVSNLILNFDDAAPGKLPTSTTFAVGSGQLVSGTFQPTEAALAQVFPQPAPVQPYGTNLSALFGATANGNWSLYVLDNSAGDSGSIALGWSLTLTTVTPVDAAADLGVTLTAPTGTLLQGASFVYTVSVTNKGPADASNVRLTNTLPNGISVTASSIPFTPAANNTWVLSLGALPVGSSTNFTTTILSTISGTWVDQVTVGSDQTDLSQADNTAQSSFTITTAPKLAIRKTGSALILNLTGPAGVYDIFAATNITQTFSTWSLVGVVTNSSGGFQYTDTNASGFTRRYYRAVLAP